MPNLTVSVSDDVYAIGRAFAARHETSVSSVVTDFLFTLHHLERSNDLLPLIDAIDLHKKLLRLSKVGRANIEPFNDKEWWAVIRHISKEMS
jgi:hypothetical protein